MKHKVYSPHRQLNLATCVFPASGSGTTITYDWEVGFSGATATRNDSGSYTCTLEGDVGDWLSGSVVGSLHLPDSLIGVNDDQSYRLNLANVYIKESGSFDVQLMSGSGTSTLVDIDGAKIHVQVFLADKVDKNS